MSTPSAPPAHIPTGSQLDDAINRASALARTVATSTERERALPPELIDELCATGLMRGCAPSTLGALEAAPAVALCGAERIARGDASAGWCVSIAVTTKLLTEYLPEEEARAIFAE